MIDRETACDFVFRGARIRVHSGAIGHQDQVMAEGRVRGYGDGPMIGIEHDDGRLTWWMTSLPIIEVEQPAEPVPTMTRHAHTRDELCAAVRAAYTFADEMALYCSPHGVSAMYAERLRERLDQALRAAASHPNASSDGER